MAGTVEQTGGYNLPIKGKKKKLNSSLSNQAHNSIFFQQIRVILQKDFSATIEYKIVDFDMKDMRILGFTQHEPKDNLRQDLVAKVLKYLYRQAKQVFRRSAK